MDDTRSAAEERSDEEVAWDKEFQDEKQEGLGSAIVDIVKLAVKVPIALLQMPLSLIPQETARHTRAAFRETFLAFRSLLSAVGDGIESALSEPDNAGPDGTWGAGPSHRAASSSSAGSATTSSTGSRSRRIEWSDEETTESGDAAEAIEGEEEGEGDETRGLKADIDY